MMITLEQAAGWSLRRLGLIEPFSSPPDAVKGLVAVQAQSWPDANLAVEVRTAQPHPLGLAAAVAPGGSLVRIWTVRGTLHIVPREEAYLHQAANSAEWLNRWGRFLERRLPVSRDEAIKRIYPRLVEWFSDKPLTHQGLADRAGLESPWRELVPHLVKDLCYLGWLTRGADDRGRAVYYAADYPRKGEISAEEARARLVRRFIGAYGPVSRHDIAYWSGWQAGQVKAALTGIGGELTPLGIVGQAGEYYLLSEQLDELQSARFPEQLPERRLPAWDVLLLAYRDKSRFIDPQHVASVFLSAARVQPIVLRQGRVIGTWDRTSGVVTEFQPKR